METIKQIDLDKKELELLLKCIYTGLSSKYMECADGLYLSQDPEQRFKDLSAQIDKLGDLKSRLDISKLDKEELDLLLKCIHGRLGNRHMECGDLHLNSISPDYEERLKVLNVEIEELEDLKSRFEEWISIESEMKFPWSTT